MDASFLVLSLVRATAPPPDQALPPLTLSARRVFWVLATFAPRDAIDQLRQLTAAAMAGQLSVADAAIAAERLGLALDRAAAGAAQERALAELVAGVHELAALRSDLAKPDGAVRHATWDIAASPLSELVAVWRVAGTPELPETIIMHLPACDDDVAVAPLSGRSYVERRVRIAYRAPATLPVLRLSSPTRSARGGEISDRAEWLQRPTSDYDLQILTEQERVKGAVVSRRLPGQLVADGARLRLRLDAPPGHATVSTELLDELGAPLTRVLCWPPVPVDRAHRGGAALG